MAVSVSLPWIPSSDQFLRAMVAGGQAGVSAQDRRPRGGGSVSFPTTNPFDQVRAEALRAKMEQEAADRAAKEQAFNLQGDLIRRGVSPQEAFAEAGLARFGVDEPVRTPNPWQTLSLGRGEVARINNQTGQLETLQQARPVDDDGVRLSTVDTSTVDPDDAALMKFLNPPRLSGSPGAISNFLSRATAPSKSGSTGGIPTVTTPEEYNALKSGEQYYDQSGNLRRKK